MAQQGEEGSGRLDSSTSGAVGGGGWTGQVGDCVGWIGGSMRGEWDWKD
jgi:hypothetical protein